MIAKFNPTGTQVHKGKLLVRVDLYPSPTDKTYPLCYIDVPDSPPPQGLTMGQIEAWWLTCPKHKQLNPVHGQFIQIASGTTRASLTNYLKQIFDASTIRQLDDAMQDVTLVSRIMKGKALISPVLITSGNIKTLINTTNTRFAGLEVSVGY